MSGEVNEKHISDNSPNASILIYALQHLGYDNYVALCDIIDNSIDAEAKNININIAVGESGFKITIADDGYGMNREVLDQSLRLGSDVDTHDIDNLGKFGMGLSTASLSLCNKTTVLTKKTDSNVILKSVTDVNEIKKENKFVKYLGEATLEDSNLFDKFLGDSECGTIVIFEDCYGIRVKQPGRFINKTKQEVGRIFRKFMKDINFRVNDELIEPIDPLMLSEEGTEVYSDEEYEIKWKDINGEERCEAIRTKLVLLPDFSQDINITKGINSVNQGFYVLRNNREIVSGFMPSGWFTKHNSLNRVRGEIYFGSNLDEAMGVDFTKNGIDMIDSIEDALKKVLKPQITAIATRIKHQITAEADKDIDHKGSADVISRKSGLLITPKAEIEKRGPKVSRGEDNPETRTRGQSRRPRNTQKVTANVEFRTMHYGRGGSIYSAYQEGRTIIIEWNVDHPFYEKFVVANKNDKTLVSSVDFLIYSLASSQIQALGDDDNKAALIESINTIMSANMRVLLS